MTTVKDLKRELFYYYVQGVLETSDKVELPPKNTLEIIRKKMEEIESMKDE